MSRHIISRKLWALCFLSMLHCYLVGFDIDWRFVLFWQITRLLKDIFCTENLFLTTFSFLFFFNYHSSHMYVTLGNTDAPHLSQVSQHLCIEHKYYICLVKNAGPGVFTLKSDFRPNLNDAFDGTAPVFDFLKKGDCILYWLLPHKANTELRTAHRLVLHF